MNGRVDAHRPVDAATAARSAAGSAAGQATGQAAGPALGLVPSSAPAAASPHARRTLTLAGLAHALHDGCTDLVVLMLPLWQAQWGLGYGALALLRGLYAGAMASLQVPAGRLARRWGTARVLATGTLLTALAWGGVAVLGHRLQSLAHAPALPTLMGIDPLLLLLCTGLLLAGAGASTQHPLASAAVARAYGAQARGPLGVYNVCGDIGKATVPAGMALLMGVIAWPQALVVLALLGAAVAVLLAVALPGDKAVAHAEPPARPDEAATPAASSGADPGLAHARGVGASGLDPGGADPRGADPRVAESIVTAAGEATPVHADASPWSRGFIALLAIGVLDSACRMGLLTFLPFLLQARGASLAQTGLALALVFGGGAAGKAVCGWLGARLGLRPTVWLTEAGTAAAITLLLVLPLAPSLALLPLLGLLLNGTSSVLYGTVPELCPPGQAERGFAWFYTGTIGAGALAPVGYGLLGDGLGVVPATAAVALSALLTLPLAGIVARALDPAGARR